MPTNSEFLRFLSALVICGSWQTLAFTKTPERTLGSSDYYTDNWTRQKILVQPELARTLTIGRGHTVSIVDMATGVSEIRHIAKNVYSPHTMLLGTAFTGPGDKLVMVAQPTRTVGVSRALESSVLVYDTKDLSLIRQVVIKGEPPWFGRARHFEVDDECKTITYIDSRGVGTINLTAKQYGRLPQPRASAYAALRDGQSLTVVSDKTLVLTAADGTEVAAHCFDDAARVQRNWLRLFDDRKQAVLLTGSGMTACNIFATDTLTLNHSTQLGEGVVHAAHLNGSNLVVATTTIARGKNSDPSNRIRFIDVETGTETHSFVVPGACQALTHDAEREQVVALFDGRLHVYSRSGELQNQVQSRFADPPNDVRLIKRGGLLAASYEDAAAARFEVRNTETSQIFIAGDWHVEADDPESGWLLLHRRRLKEEKRLTQLGLVNTSAAVPSIVPIELPDKYSLELGRYSLRHLDDGLQVRTLDYRGRLGSLIVDQDGLLKSARFEIMEDVPKALPVQQDDPFGVGKIMQTSNRRFNLDRWQFQEGPASLGGYLGKTFELVDLEPPAMSIRLEVPFPCPAFLPHSPWLRSSDNANLFLFHQKQENEDDYLKPFGSSETTRPYSRFQSRN